jgi:excisionase family DNA binding protein
MNELLTREEVMALLKISRSTLIRLQRSGTLATIRLTHQLVRIPRSAVEKFLDERTSPSEPIR